jgi:hypothetical protein
VILAKPVLRATFFLRRNPATIRDFQFSEAIKFLCENREGRPFRFSV